MVAAARLAYFITAFLVAFVSARNTRHHNRRSTLTINDPSAPIIECGVTTFSWSGTKAPYQVGVLVGNYSAAPLYHLGNTTSQSFAWEVDLAAGTIVTLAVKSASGTIAYSGKTAVQAGLDSSCLTNSTWHGGSSTSAGADADSTALAGTGNATVTASMSFATVVGNATTSAAAGIGGAAAQTMTTDPSTTTSTTSSATRATAGIGLLLGALILALAA